MSEFYNAYFIKTQNSEDLKSRFSNVLTIPDSEWVVCDFGDDYPDGMFEPDHYFTPEISQQFGETIYLCVDFRDDQFEYEHSKDGEVLRKLCWCSDGAQCIWSSAEGEPEAWEADAIFSEANFAKAQDMIKYDEHLVFVSDDVYQSKEQELRSIWAEHRFVLEDIWPLVDAAVPLAIQKFYGLVLPSLEIF
jgi:hypothetical protein